MRHGLRATLKQAVISSPTPQLPPFHMVNPIPQPQAHPAPLQAPTSAKHVGASGSNMRTQNGPENRITSIIQHKQPIPQEHFPTYPLSHQYYYSKTHPKGTQPPKRSAQPRPFSHPRNAHSGPTTAAHNKIMTELHTSQTYTHVKERGPAPHDRTTMK